MEPWVQLGYGTPPLWVGEKARTLWELKSAGFPTPEAFVTTMEKPPKGLPEWEQFIVRSSSNIEGKHSAAGLFQSIGPVSRDELPNALHSVFQSKNAPHVLAFYKQNPGLPAPSMAALIQRWIPGKASVAYSRDPYDFSSDAFWVQTKEGFSSQARGLGSPIERLLVELEKRFTYPVDVEFVTSPDKLIILQVRPLIPQQHVKTFSSSALPSAGHWVRNLTHNPLPLSPAHEFLVRFLGQGLSDPSALVIDGFLFEKKQPLLSPTPLHGEEFEAEFSKKLQELATYANRIEFSFPQQLLHFRSMTRAYTKLQTTARRAPPQFNWMTLRDYLTEHFADSETFPTSWDVSAQTWKPKALSFPNIQNCEEFLLWFRQIDDFFYLRAQKNLSLVLRDLGAKLKVGEDIFWVLPSSPTQFPPVNKLKEEAILNRSKHQTRMRQLVPRAIIDGQPLFAPTQTASIYHGTLLSQPFSGVATDNILCQEPGRVFLCTDITPAQVPHLKTFAGVLVEKNDPMGHAATLLRYLNIPHALGCKEISKAKGQFICAMETGHIVCGAAPQHGHHEE